MTILGKGPVAYLMPKTHIFGHIADKYRYTAFVLNHNLLDVINILYQSFAADKTCHMLLFDVSTAGVYVVLAQGIENLPHGYVSGVQLLATQGNLVLFDATTKRVHFNHARYHR